MTLDQFRSKWGRKWSALVTGEMFKDATETIEGNSSILQVISRTHEDIRDMGHIFLAEQRGFLIYSNAIKNLHTPPPENVTDLGEEEYPDPLTEEKESAKPKRKTRK